MKFSAYFIRNVLMHDAKSRILAVWKLIFPVLKETKVMNHEESSVEQV